MDHFTLILMPPPSDLPLFSFYQELLRVPPQPLALTLAGIALGLLLLRRLAGQPAPLFFRAAVVFTAVLTLGWRNGLVPVFDPLVMATAGVLLLLLDEAVHVLASVFGLLGYAGTGLVSDARRWLNATKSRSLTLPPAPKEVD